MKSRVASFTATALLILLMGCGNGTSTSTSPSSSLTAPTIATVTPPSGPIGGGTAITITGTNFAAGATVTIGGTAATGISVTSSTTITATTAAHAGGAVDVVVTNTDAGTGTKTGAFAYIPPPTVTGSVPNGGPVAGGTSVTLTGTNFFAGATVTFGGVAGTNVNVASATQISATVPAHTAGAVDITVRNADNQSGTLTNGFTYSNAPTAASISPATGSTTGGTSVVITGTNFLNGALVTIGGVAATSVVVNSPTQISAITPAHGSGTFNVQVSNPDTQTGTLAGAYVYVGPPVITTIAASSAISTGGQTITVFGVNLQAGAGGGQVLFGTTPGTNVSSNPTSTQLQVTVPAHAVGTVDFTVVNPDGQQAKIVNGFRFGSVLFQEDFETATLNNFTFFTPTTVVISPTAKKFGAFGASFLYQLCGDPTLVTCQQPAHQSKDIIVEKDFLTAGNPANPGNAPGLYHVFVRGYVNFQSPQNLGTKDIQRKIFFVKDPAGPNGNPNQNWAWFLTSDGGNNKIFLRLSFQSVSTTTPTFGINGPDNELGDPGIQSGIAALDYDTWYSIEMEVQRKSGPGLSDCIIRIWVDGVLKFQKTTNWTANQFEHPFPDDAFNTGLTRIEIGAQADRLNFVPIDEFRFWDNIVIADAYIGP